MRNPNDQALALECLRLAHSCDRTEAVVGRARAYFDFVTGAGSEASAADIIQAASRDHASSASS